MVKELSEQQLKEVQQLMGIAPDFSTTAPLDTLRGRSVKETAELIRAVIKGKL